MPPISVMIKPVSGLCNMRCKYCFYVDEMANRQVPLYEKMSLDTLETLVRRALRYAEGSAYFAFQGGEPTLAGVEFFEKLIEFQKKYNVQGVQISNSVQTNGYQLDDKLIELFAREKFLLGVSVDGDKVIHDSMRVNAAGKGTFDQIMENVARLKAAGVEYNLLCVVNKEVAQRPAQVFDALKDAGYIQFINCLDGLDGKKQPFSLTNEDLLPFMKVTFDRYYDSFMKGQYVSVRSYDNYVGHLLGQEMESCAMRGQCGNYYLIEADGGVYPCDFYVLDQWRLGNIKEDSFFRLEKNPLAATFRGRSLNRHEKCRSCKWFSLCRDGCPREREENRLNRFCETYQAFFEYALPKMQQMARKIAQDERR